MSLKWNMPYKEFFFFSNGLYETCYRKPFQGRHHTGVNILATRTDIINMLYLITCLWLHPASNTCFLTYISNDILKFV